MGKRKKRVKRNPRDPWKIAWSVAGDVWKFMTTLDLRHLRLWGKVTLKDGYGKIEKNYDRAYSRSARTVQDRAFELFRTNREAWPHLKDHEIETAPFKKIAESYGLMVGGRASF